MYMIISVAVTWTYIPDKQRLHVRTVVLCKALVLVSEGECNLLLPCFINDVLFVFARASLANTTYT